MCPLSTKFCLLLCCYSAATGEAILYDDGSGRPCSMREYACSLSRLFSSVSTQSWGWRASYIFALWNFILDLVDICVFKMQRILSIKENYKKCGVVTH